MKFPTLLLASMALLGGCTDINPGFVGRDSETSGPSTTSTSSTTASSQTSEMTTGGSSATSEADTGVPTATGVTTGETTGMTGMATGEPTDPRGTCGDGVVDEKSEECDEGDYNGDGMGVCNEMCKLVECGDGIVDDLYEECDEGKTGNGPFGTCSLDCKSPSCGDGQLSPDEVCDGSYEVNENCDQACNLKTCGDGILDQEVEVCEYPMDLGCLPSCRNAPSVTFDNEGIEWLEIGVKGATVDWIDCMGKTPVAGIFGSFDNNPQEQKFSKVGTRCATYDEEVFGDFAYIYAGSGFYNSDMTVGVDPVDYVEYEINCPESRVLTGIGGSQNAKEFEMLFLWCSRVVLYPSEKAWGLHMTPPVPADAAGVMLDGLPMLSAKCSNGRAVSGMKVSATAGGGIQTIKIGCRTLVVE